MMKLLLENGAQVNAQDLVGATALMYSCWAAHTPCVQLLLDQGADTTICTNSDQLSPLHAAALSGRIACVSALHEKGAQINARDIDGATPLHKAASRGDANIVSFLLEVGAPANATDKDGNTPLHCMAQTGSVACLQCVADMNNEIDLNCASALGLRPIHVSAFACNSDFTSALISLGADVNAAANDGSTALHFACERGDERAVEALLAAKANAMARDANGQTCLHCAAATGHKSILRMLLRTDADIDAPDNQERTALHLAAIGGHSGTMGVMLFGSTAADCSLCDDQGGTSLHYAAYAESAQSTKMLLSQGVNPMRPDLHGNTPLHIAAAAGHTDTVQLLLAAVESSESSPDCAASASSPPPLKSAAVGSCAGQAANGDGQQVSGTAGSSSSSRSGSGSPGAATPAAPATDGGSTPAAAPTPLRNQAYNVSDREGHSPLYYAARGLHRDTMHYLLQKGATFSEADRAALTEEHRQDVLRVLGEEMVLEYFRESAQELFGLEYSEEAMLEEAVDCEVFEIPAQKEADYKEALELFNVQEKPHKAVRLLIEREVLRKRPRSVAHFLYARADDLDKAALGDYLGEESEFEDQVRAHYTSFLCFDNLEFDMSLRRFLQKFRLPGEAQKIDRLMRSFATHYYASRGEDSVFHTADATYVTAFATIMLNTDAHSPNIKKEDKMTLDGFLKNVESVRDFNQGHALEHAWLEDLYNRIVNNPIKMQQDTQFANSQRNGWLTVREKSKGRRTKKTPWKRRWVELCDSQLHWLKKPGDNQPVGTITLSGSEVVLTKSKGKKKRGFAVISGGPGAGGPLSTSGAGSGLLATTGGSSASGGGGGGGGDLLTCYFVCEDEKECMAWVDAVRAFTRNAAQPIGMSVSLYDLPDVADNTGTSPGSPLGSKSAGDMSSILQPRSSSSSSESVAASVKSAVPSSPSPSSFASASSSSSAVPAAGSSAASAAVGATSTSAAAASSPSSSGAASPQSSGQSRKKKKKGSGIRFSTFEKRRAPKKDKLRKSKSSKIDKKGSLKSSAHSESERDTSGQSAESDSVASDSPLSTSASVSSVPLAAVAANDVDAEEEDVAADATNGRSHVRVT